MSRFPAYLLALVLAASFVGAAPGPKDGQKGGLFLPTNVGDRLVLEETRRTPDGESKRVLSREVTSVEQKDGVVVVTVLEDGGATTGPKSEQYGASESGVALLSRGGQIYDPPMCVLRLPAKVGASWEVNIPGEVPLTVRYTTGTEEQVEVPAGKFRALRVDREFEINGRTVRSTDWAVRGLGSIKATARVGNDIEVLQVLKSFTPGKKPAK